MTDKEKCPPNAMCDDCSKQNTVLCPGLQDTRFVSKEWVYPDEDVYGSNEKVKRPSKTS